MAARLAPDNLQRTQQCLHHFVAHAPWGDEALLAQVRSHVLPAMTKPGAVVAWMVDDTGGALPARAASKPLAPALPPCAYVPPTGTT
jgi:SRSO17 transposase